MKKEILIFFISSVFVFAMEGINPSNPSLNNETSTTLYDKCKKNELDSIDSCQKAILYELHLNDNMHKGVSEALFIPEVSEWVDALSDAEIETDYFSIANFKADTALLGAMQGNTNVLSMGYEMTSKLSVLNNSIETYSDLMHNVTKQSLVEFKIEATITELLYAEEMAKELKNFETKKRN